MTCLKDGRDKAYAAGHFHAGHSDLHQIVEPDDGGKLLDVRGDIIELRATDQYSPAEQQLAVEVTVGHRNAIRGDQQPGALEHARTRRQQTELHRPVRECGFVRGVL
ncbi:MAG: hypothetical protein JSU86_18470, partial [Phycisphaerales bacterium]